MKIRILFIGLFAAIAILAVNSISFAQSLSVDPGFSPAPTKELISDTTLYPLSNGKYIFHGQFNGQLGSVGGLVRGGIARLNSDFSLDTSFNCNRCSAVSRVAEQPDGKLLVSGSVLNNIGTVLIIRLNLDGSYDPTFISPTVPPGGASFYFAWGTQPDGKILTVSTADRPGFRFNRLHRLNQDGSVDPTFTDFTVLTGVGSSGFTQITPLPNGQIMVAGGSTLNRLNSNGTIDTTFQKPVLATYTSSVTPVIHKFEVQSDGKIFFVGYFIWVNGVSIPSGMVRLNPDQGVDFTFTQSVPTDFSPADFLRFQNGKYVIRRTFSLLCPCADLPLFMKFNNDGSIDSTFSPPSNLDLSSVSLIRLDNKQRVLINGTFAGGGNQYARIMQDGPLDSYLSFPGYGALGNIYAVTSQADNKAIITGEFSKVNDIARGRIARVNLDGSLDMGFMSNGVGFDAYPTRLAMQADGKILAAGPFTSFNGSPAGPLIRLNPDGTKDTAFNPTFNSSFIWAIAIQPDGKILIGGGFTIVNGIARSGIVRLNHDGTTDASLATIVGPGVQALIAEPDGKIVMGGGFSGVNGFPRQNLVRLNADGTLDNTFNAGSISGLSQISRISNGKYFYRSGANDLTGTVRKLNADGSPDNSFALSVGGSVDKFIAFDDGSLIIGGSFTSLNNNSRINIARINPGGSPDNSLMPYGSNGVIRDLALQPDGKVLAGGDFNIIGGESRLAVARLNVSSAPLAPQAKRFDFDGDGKADIAVYRSSNNTWYIFKSGTGQLEFHNFGLGGDILTPADFDGDQKFDISIFKPSTGFTWFREVTTGNYNGTQFGASGDIPVHSDYTGDGKADYVVFRPSNGVWYRYDRINNQTSIIQFGALNDIPVIADFDGDGKTDLAVFRPSTGDWYWMNSSNGQFFGYHFGATGDLTVPADYDGDGKTDLAVYRLGNGVWYRILSGNGQFASTQFGIATDKPIPADYDGDGKADIGVFRQGLWIILNSQSGSITGFQFGTPTDDPIPNAYVR